MIKNTAGQKIGAEMITAADGTIFAGAVTVYVTGDAGTQALGSVGSGVCTSEGNGYYTYAPAQAETNYSLVAFTFIGTGAISTTVQVFTQIVQQTADNDTKISTLITGVDLNADAIKAVSYDESTAFPLTAVNGSTLTEAGGTGDQFTGLPDVTTDSASRTASKADVSALALDATVAKSVNALSDIIWTDARAGYQDNLNIGEDVVGVSDIAGLNDLSVADVTTGCNASLDAAIPGSPTGDSINDYVFRVKQVMINKMEITEANGNTIIYGDNDVAVYANVLAAYTSDATTTTRKRLE